MSRRGRPVRPAWPSAASRPVRRRQARTSWGASGLPGVGRLAAVGDTREGLNRPRRIFSVTYVIAEPCVDVLDRACVEECPVDCIYEGARMLYIHPDECVDCGACEPVCPVEAIFYED